MSGILYGLGVGPGRSGTADTESPSSDPRESCDLQYQATI